MRQQDRELWEQLHAVAVDEWHSRTGETRPPTRDELVELLRAEDAKKRRAGR